VTLSLDPRPSGKIADFPLKRTVILFFAATLLVFILDYATTPQYTQAQYSTAPAATTTTASSTTSCEKFLVAGNAVNVALGKWVGIKAVYYNFPNGTVKLEQWVDDSTDNINAPGSKWHKVLDFNDHGQWGGGQPNCGGTPSTIITWGGPGEGL